MSIIRRYVDYMDRQAAAFPTPRWLSLGGALFCAALIGYVLGSDAFASGRIGFLLMFTGMLMGALQDFVISRWVRFIVVPAVGGALLISSAVMLVRAHVS